MATVQVGAFCYADHAAAAVASCAAYPLALGASSGGLVSSECVGTLPDGSLTIRSGFQPLPCAGASCVWTYTDSSITPTYSPCWHGDVVDAGLLILAALLTAWASCYGLYRLYKMFTFSRGDAL